MSQQPSKIFPLCLLLFVSFCKQNPSGAGRRGGGGGSQQDPSFFTCADPEKQIPKERFFLVNPAGDENTNMHRFKTITAALKAAEEEEEVEDAHICVKSGSYDESFFMNQKTKQTLECEDTAGRSCIIAPDGSTTSISFSTNVVDNHTKAATIQGFTFKGPEANSGMSIMGSHNIFLKDLTFENHRNEGLTVLMSQNVHFHNIAFKDNNTAKGDSRQNFHEIEIKSSPHSFYFSGSFEIETSYAPHTAFGIEGGRSSETKIYADSVELRNKISSFGVTHSIRVVEPEPDEVPGEEEVN